jgi:curved DNA-binding protein CbpA
VRTARIGSHAVIIVHQGVAKDASSDDIRKAYKKLAVKHHPDKGGDEAKFKEIQEAANVLMDDDKRRVSVIFFILFCPFAFHFPFLTFPFLSLFFTQTLCFSLSEIRKKSFCFSNFFGFCSQVYDEHGKEGLDAGMGEGGDPGDLFSALFGGGRGGGGGGRRQERQIAPITRKIELTLEDFYCGKTFEVPIERKRPCCKFRHFFSLF